MFRGWRSSWLGQKSSVGSAQNDEVLLLAEGRECFLWHSKKSPVSWKASEAWYKNEYGQEKCFVTWKVYCQMKKKNGKKEKEETHSHFQPSPRFSRWMKLWVNSSLCGKINVWFRTQRTSHTRFVSLHFVTTHVLCVWSEMPWSWPIFQCNICDDNKTYTQNTWIPNDFLMLTQSLLLELSS